MLHLHFEHVVGYLLALLANEADLVEDELVFAQFGLPDGLRDSLLEELEDVEEARVFEDCCLVLLEGDFFVVVGVHLLEDKDDALVEVLPHLVSNALAGHGSPRGDHALHGVGEVTQREVTLALLVDKLVGDLGLFLLVAIGDFVEVLNEFGKLNSAILILVHNCEERVAEEVNRLEPQQAHVFAELLLGHLREAMSHPVEPGLGREAYRFSSSATSEGENRVSLRICLSSDSLLLPFLPPTQHEVY